MGYIAAAIVGGGKIAGNNIEKGGNKRANAALAEALSRLKAIDIGEVVNLADERDVARFAKQFEVQREHDPLLAEARDQGAAKLVEGLKDDPQADALLRSMQSGALRDSPQRDQIIDQLFAGAKSELDAGATLPPEFQQELVRAGLEATSRAGVGGDYRAAGGVPQRALLGQAGINLKAHRQGQAMQALTMADQLKQQRQAILSNATTQTENIAGQRQGRAINAFTAGQSSVPAIGLRGSDVANLSLQNTAFENWREWTHGNINANLSIKNAALDAKTANVLGETIGSIYGGVMGAGATPAAGAGVNSVGPIAGGYQLPPGAQIPNSNYVNTQGQSVYGPTATPWYLATPKY